MLFRFPPPPPPPPAATSANDSPLAYGNQRDGHSRGGGQRGHSRSRGQPRGGGTHGLGGNSRGGRGGARGGYQHHRGGHQPSVSIAGYSQQQYQSPAPTNIPPAQAYINPDFVDQSHTQPRHSHIDPHSLAQVMSYMSTPAGVQSMAAFASHMTISGNAHAQASQTLPSRQAPSELPYSSSRQPGQKRKLVDRNNNNSNNNNNTQGLTQANKKSQGSKPPRAKAAVAPPVPSFGFSLPLPSLAPQHGTSASTNTPQNQKKRKLNLGLTDNAFVADPPNNIEDQNDEDLDEEAAYAQKLKGGGFTFEHNGEQIVIQTAAEVEAWIKDRRKHFPTQKRIAEKAQEDAEKRVRELEFLRKLRGAPLERKQGHMPQEDKPSMVRCSQLGREDVKQSSSKVDKDQENLAALRKKLHESMINKQDQTPTVNLNVGYESDSSLATDAESSVVSSSSDDLSSEEDSEDSEEASDDEAPTTLSSKAQPPPIRVPPPAPTPQPATTHKADVEQGKKLCDTWQRTGRCKFSNKCRYAHPPRSQDTSRFSLYDRLVEQECVESDGRTLEAIKWLGNHGLLG